jgi:Ca2+/H+ antiporter, TMEM165/GDT1 family
VAFGSVLLTAYSVVLIAELIGDKLIYTVATLAARFRAALVMTVMAAAFGGKMLIAVLLGSVLTRIPTHWTALLSAAVFFAAALVVWRRRLPAVGTDEATKAGWSRAAVVSFGSLFLTEWGDPGQLAAAALAVQAQWPVAVWLGGTLALMTKGTLAVLLGAKLQELIPERVIRPVATATCCLLGVLALGQAVWP